MSSSFWSSMRWRVMTDTDCGISRSDNGSLPPMVTLGAVVVVLDGATVRLPSAVRRSSSPLPVSARAVASSTVNWPEMAGADLPATSSARNEMTAPAMRAIRVSETSSWPAGKSY
ncbi:hypothetical protein G6F57_023124 [Rhizopus arrhizus]|nr:hypothetical protein G6F57_023124 [Rhizopus arrhizus]